MGIGIKWKLLVSNLNNQQVHNLPGMQITQPIQPHLL